ncbi:DUF418 domain-containing protein [Alkalicoccobacillus porphyridii]|uniref:DUF1624 domain-containing protein n=1 Tax=Alkalicoccobacillus porphyridii TaxID=2597270 RepID=A0A554A249_9BACI|nr:heparan-alpha-glucosaminide N-acetyltransferase domain-containing protein [Alkalicoccobacillus porphyridii]TSB47771.1 DUF1624 domain-containing protein [Alkalicoccobacillus porphyridii]
MSNNQSKNRVEGLDFARALAMFGMLVMNFMVVTGAQGNGAPALVWFTNLFEGRAAATFVTLAGIGISLMTRKARLTSEKTITTNVRVSLLKRSLFLFILGMLLYTIGWSGDILHYYGFYMAFAALVMLASPKLMILIIALTAFVAQFYQVIFDYMSGWSPTQPFLEYLDFWTVTGFLRNLFLNGYHPVFPWLGFLLIGMLIGRLNLVDRGVRKSILIVSTITLVATELLSRILILSFSSSILDAESAAFLFETGPIPPNLFYLVSNTASALLIIILSIYLAEKWANNFVVRSLIYTGQLTLTHYVSHVVIGIGILLLFNKVILFNGAVSQPLSFTFLYACFFFTGSIIFSVLWRRKYNRGPIELLMRKWS